MQAGTVMAGSRVEWHAPLGQPDTLWGEALGNRVNWFQRFEAWRCEACQLVLMDYSHYYGRNGIARGIRSDSPPGV